jgi:LysM repeat protein
LLPDNNDETARILCIAGTWLKRRDPDTADLFYKALVRRCRQTALGAQADAMRWFPVLDENGNPIPHLRAQKSSIPKELTLMTEQASDSLPATEPDNDTGTPTEYIVKAGDTLIRIAATFSTAEHSISMKEILEANPGLWSDRLRVGLRILIPAAKTTASTEATDLPR